MDVDLVEVGQSLPGRVQHREPRANAVGGCGVAREEIGRGAHRKVRAGGAGGFLGGVDEPGEPLRAVRAGRGLGGEQGEFGSQCAVPAASRGVGRDRDFRCQLLVGDVGGQRRCRTASTGSSTTRARAAWPSLRSVQPASCTSVEGSSPAVKATVPSSVSEMGFARSAAARSASAVGRPVRRISEAVGRSARAASRSVSRTPGEAAPSS